MSDCINWKYGKCGQGYGRVTIAGKPRPVHRLMFWIANGFYPPVVRHTCDNPACYNPEHLLGGTVKDNVRDRCDRGRSFMKCGEASPMARIKESDVIDILDRWALGHKVGSIADDYGYSLSGINGIVRGTNWKHINKEQYHERRKENIFANTSNRGGEGSRKAVGKRAPHRRIENGKGDDTKGIKKGGDMRRGGGMRITKGKAVRKFGTKAALARFLGINRQAIQQWPDRKPIADKYAAKLVEAFGEDGFK